MLLLYNNNSMCGTCDLSALEFTQNFRGEGDSEEGTNTRPAGTKRAARSDEEMGKEREREGRLEERACCQCG